MSYGEVLRYVILKFLWTALYKFHGQRNAPKPFPSFWTMIKAMPVLCPHTRRLVTQKEILYFCLKAANLSSECIQLYSRQPNKLVFSMDNVDICSIYSSDIIIIIATICAGESAKEERYLIKIIKILCFRYSHQFLGAKESIV